jgi:DHA2 family multidrug resistance protein
MSSMAQAAAINDPRVLPALSSSADRASLTSWIAVLASMIGAFMAILNIQINNASLLDIEGGIGTGVDNGAWISTSYLTFIGGSHVS